MTEDVAVPQYDLAEFWRSVRVPTADEQDRHMLKRLSILAEQAVQVDGDRVIDAQHQMVLVWGNAGWVHLAEYALMNLVNLLTDRGWIGDPLVEGYLDLLAAWAWRHIHTAGAALCAVRAFYGLSTGVPLCLLVGATSVDQEPLVSIPQEALPAVREQVGALVADMICTLETCLASDKQIISGCMKLLSGECDVDDLSGLPEDIVALVVQLSTPDAEQPEAVEVEE